MSPALDQDQIIEWIKQALRIIKGLDTLYVQGSTLKEGFIDFQILSEVTSELLLADSAFAHLTPEAFSDAINVVLAVMILIEDDANSNLKRKQIRRALSEPTL